MKRNGFTLIELLAVIIMVSLLVLLVLPNIFNSVKNSSKDTDKLTKEMIYKASELYISNHPDDFIKLNGSQYIISLEDLVKEKYLSSPIKMFAGDDITDDKCVQVLYDGDYKYELKDIGDCSEKLLICNAIKEETKGKYNIGDEYLCEVKPGINYTFYILSVENDKVNLIMDSNIAIDGTPIKTNEDITRLKNLGKQYDSAWISTEDYDGDACDPTDPIVQENASSIGSSVANYCSKEHGKTIKGPITAFKYLKSATSSWVYIPNISIDYKDENIESTYFSSGTATDNSYGGIKTDGEQTEIFDNQNEVTATFNNLKARLPKYEEINNLFPIEINETNQLELRNIYTKRENFLYKLPEWIVKHLPNYHDSVHGNVVKEQYDNCIADINETGVCALSGYWLLSSVKAKDNNSHFAYDVSTDGHYGFSVTNATSKYYEKIYTGIRPVITLNKNNLY